MSGEPSRSLDRPAERVLMLHLALVFVASASYEALFVHHGIAWLFDEGWPLYAAKQLHEGGVLYRDVFFPFPPGHLLPAWIAWWADPPGVVFARWIYAGFSVALCAALYLLGRRVMPPRFALLGALLLAVAAPRSHLAHLLFGYRFLVWSVLALLALAAYQRTRARRWVLLAGLLTGVSLYFRLTPAFAVACGTGVALVAMHRKPAAWVSAGALYAAGVLAVAVPLAAYFEHTVGLATVWREVVVRIIGLQDLQSKPIPELVALGSSARRSIYQNFVPVQYWAYIAMYCGYGVALAIAWRRSAREQRELTHALLLAIVVWGGIYLLRTLGRSDEHHLTSALPPACLLLAHLCHLGFERVRKGRAPNAALERILVGFVLCCWVFLQGSDLYLAAPRRGVHPIPAVAELGEDIRITSERKAERLDRKIVAIRRLTSPEDTILDLTNAPLLHALTGRNGPGYIDVITPGVFMNEHEQHLLVERLEARPPALVVWPARDFDDMPSRSVQVTAPILTEWVKARYRPARADAAAGLLVPR